MGMPPRLARRFPKHPFDMRLFRMHRFVQAIVVTFGAFVLGACSTGELPKAVQLLPVTETTAVPTAAPQTTVAPQTTATRTPATPLSTVTPTATPQPTATATPEPVVWLWGDALPTPTATPPAPTATAEPEDAAEVPSDEQHDGESHLTPVLVEIRPAQVLPETPSGRTVVMPEQITLSPDQIPALATDARGVLLTRTGFTVPILSGGEGAWNVLTPCANEAQVATAERRSAAAHVVLDPGHGGPETGAVGPTGTVEGDLNMDIARRLASRLRAQGLTVELTREASYRSTLHTRAEVAEALKPVVFLSIHHNGGQPEPIGEPGTEVYFQVDKPEAERFGALLYEELFNAFAQFEDVEWTGTVAHGAQWRLNERGQDIYGILRRAPNVVSALSEAAFLSTAAEEQALLDPAVRELEAAALERAILRYMVTSDPGSGVIEGSVFPPGSISNSGGSQLCVDPAFE